MAYRKGRRKKSSFRGKRRGGKRRRGKKLGTYTMSRGGIKL